MLNLERRARKPSLLACLGGLLAATAVGLSAYASHGIAEPLAQSHVNTAALFAFGHGVALAVLGPTQQNSVGKLALYVLLLARCCSPAAWSPARCGSSVPGWPRWAAPR
jgi:hypothetical protein